MFCPKKDAKIFRPAHYLLTTVGDQVAQAVRPGTSRHGVESLTSHFWSGLCSAPGRNRTCDTRSRKGRSHRRIWAGGRISRCLTRVGRLAWGP